MPEGLLLSSLRQQQIREEMQRVLESAAFRTSKRCREFLQYIVEQTVNGSAGSLKERSIGIEVFGLPQDYDTSQHTVVRVTATEVRKKLAQYYVSENGTHHDVRIELPPGSYNAEFRWSTVPEPVDEPPAAEIEAEVPLVEQPVTVDPPVPAEPAVPAAPAPRWPLVAGVAAVAVVICAAGYWAWRGAKADAPAPKETARAVAPPVAAAADDGTVRLSVGSTAPYLDRNGHNWTIDRFFSGGFILNRTSERIARTLDPDLYRHPRVGDFRYDIPLAQGSYEMHLHFAETALADMISAESSGEGQRLFRVAANGKVLLDYFDVVADAAGISMADERVFRDISPGEDGVLHLAFSPLRGSAMLSGIELFPVERGKVRPLRIRSGWPTAWKDAAGQLWRSDTYFLGGNALVRRTNPARESGSPNTGIYASERWGHFTYALPVADGRYRVTIKFNEGYHGPRNSGLGGVGSRLFDVFANGVALLRDFDIMKEAGGEGRPLDKVFSGLRPNAQGKIILSFVPVKGMACVNAIEVEEEAR